MPAPNNPASAKTAGKTQSRPAFTPTPEQRCLVRAGALAGLPQDAIAGAIGVDRKTLTKNFAVELEHAKTEVIARAERTLVDLALGIPEARDERGVVTEWTREPDEACLMFLLKTRAGWRETNHPEISDPDDGPFKFKNLTYEEVNERIDVLLKARAEREKSPS